jgi:hypothetical protein
MAMETATVDPAMAISPMSPSGEKLEPAVPPWPVVGAPTGIIVPVPAEDAGFAVAIGFFPTGFFEVTGRVVVGFVGGVVPVVPATVVVVVVVVVAVVVVVGVARHVGTVMVLSSSVTAPV